MGFRVIDPSEFEWITRPHETGEPALQTVNRVDEELLVYAYGTPPESEHAELLEPAVQSPIG